MRHQPLAPLTNEQRQLVEDNYKLVFAGCKKYRRGDIDRELMEAEFGYALCQAAAIVACEWVKLACQRQKLDLERVGKDPAFKWHFDRSRKPAAPRMAC